MKGKTTVMESRRYSGKTRRHVQFDVGPGQKRRYCETSKSLFLFFNRKNQFTKVIVSQGSPLSRNRDRVHP